MRLIMSDCGIYSVHVYVYMRKQFSDFFLASFPGSPYARGKRPAQSCMANLYNGAYIAPVSMVTVPKGFSGIQVNNACKQLLQLVRGNHAVMPKYVI